MNHSTTPGQQPLPPQIVEQVLTRLGFNPPPELNLQGLRRLYSAWCQNVPFDNVRKLIHVRSGNPGPLPGNSPTDFLEGWLKFGAGGTCWAGNGAFQAVLHSLGFEALRGVGTMLVAPDVPPNHGTVAVRLGNESYLVDCSMLHGEPLLLSQDRETFISHTAWGLQCSPREGRWLIAWRPLHRLEGFECRLERFGASAEDFQQLHSRTRDWSPFNYQVTARINRGEKVIGLAFGKAVTIESDGSPEQQPVSDAERRRILLEEIGLSEELVSQLPEDIPTPPPPASKTAQTQLQTA